jgi:uncharacterized OsmC-like protein
MAPMSGDTGLQNVATAIRRVETVLTRRPDIGLHDDAPATARWEGGNRAVSSHENGTQIVSDMPKELGGGGEHVTPGWLFRAGFASCAATSIAMNAAIEGIELTQLEVRATSRSDVRGLLGMTDSDGTPVYAGPCDVQLSVRISANGVSRERLQALVEEGLRRSPIPNAVQHAVPVAVNVQIDTGA